MAFGRPFNPVSAKQGKQIARADQRCSCTYDTRAILSPIISRTNPTCPIHGAGRPAGTGK